MKKLMYFLVFFSGMAFCHAQNYYSFNWDYRPSPNPSNNAEVRVNLEGGGQQTVFISFQDPNASRKMLNLPAKIASAQITIANFPDNGGPSCSENNVIYNAGACGVSFTQVCGIFQQAAIVGDFRLIDIATQSVDTSYPECEEIEIPITFEAPCSPNTQDLVVENWFYRLPNQPWRLLSGHAGERRLRFDASELSNNPADYLNLAQVIELRPTFELYPEEVIYDITIRPCPPILVGNPITEAASCHGIDDGTVTLRFDRNAFEDGNYQMRYYVFDGNANLNFDPNTENPPSTVEENILPGLIPANDGTGDYLGILPVGIGAGEYKIVYQEFLDDGNGVDILVNGRGLSPNFTIDEPTEIEASATFEQALCPGDPASINFSAMGGDNLNPGGTYSYEYLVVGNGNGWTDVMGNSTEILPTTSAQTIQIRATYDNSTVDINDDCLSSVITPPGSIDAEIPPLQFSNTTGGVASSTTSTEGVVRTDFAGGTGPYTFVLTKENEITGVFETVPNPDSTNDIDTIEFTGLGVGTYRITVNANGCPSTTGDIEVTPAPTPQLEDPVPTNPFCASGTDGSVSFVISNPTNLYQYRIVDDNNNEVDSGSGIASPALPIPIASSNLNAGNYTIEVIYDTGSFDPAAGVASKPFSITDPNPITISLSDIVGLDCNGVSDGYIEVSISETGDFQYAYANLAAWNDLPADGRIPISQSGTYNDIKVRKLRTPSDPVGCESVNAINNIFVPDGLTITEDILQRQNVTTNGGNDGAIFIDVTGGNNGLTPTYTFEWTAVLQDNTITYTPETTQNIENLFAGNYTVTVTDEKTCIKTFGPIEITEPGPFSIESPTGTPTCNGQSTGSVTARAQGTGLIRFDFFESSNPGNIVFTDTTTERTVTASNLPAGDYGFTATEIDSGSDLTTQPVDYFTINELTAISATVTPTDATCALPTSGVITVTAATGGSNNGYTYGIDDGFPAQTSNIFTNLSPRDYIVTVTDDLGCEYTETVTIEAGELPVLNELTTVVTNASSATSLDGSIVLEFETDPTNYTYAWSGPGVTGIITKDLNTIAAGTYQVIVSAPGNCRLTRNFTVGVQAVFSIQSFSGTPTCFNQANGSLTATIEATGLVTFNWILDNGSANGTLVASEATNLRTLSTTGLPAGTYYLEIVDTNNVIVRSTNNVEIIELAEVSALVTPVPTCLGETTGSITFSAPTGSPSNNYTYSIDNGATFQASPIFENLAAAAYTPRVSAFENPNCDYIAPGVIITNSPVLFWDLPNSQITRASGPGANDGAISVAFTGGTAPYTYVWNPNPTNSTIQNITGVGAGTYNLTITDAANCSISQDFEVSEVGPLSITNIVPTAVLCRGEANGSITTTVTGEGTINYLWTLANGDPVPVSNGVNGPNITGIAAGNYILTATDINSTVATASIAIGEPATSLSITNITPNNISCFGGSDGSIAIAATGGSGGYTFSINGGAFQPSPINGLIANSYTIRVRDVNDCEFTEPTPVLLTEPEELNLIINEQRPVTAASATDGAIFITAEGGSGNYTYNWTGPNGYASTEEDILSLGAGDYSVTITDANFGINNDAGCRLISNTITIAEPGVLIANINQSVFLECSGDDFAEITANVQGGVLPYVYEWFQVTNGNNTALTEDTDIIANLSAGTYFLRVTDANSVTRDTNSVVITAPSQVVVTIDGTTNVLCVGQPTGSANITVTGGTPPYQYFWSNASTVADVSGLDAGEYTIEVEDANGCNSQNTITITAPDDAVQIADVTIINVSAYQALDGSISLDVAGGSAPYNYIWTRDSDNSNVGNQATISNLAADSYTVIVSDANGCNITETYEVSQPDIIEETIVQPSCTGESDGSISVLVNQGNGSSTYLWNTGSTENNINNLGAGNYSVTVTGLAGGPQTRNYVLENPIPLEVNLGLDRVLCANQVLELDATVDDPTASYSWTSDNGFSSSNAEVVLSQTGNYTVTVESQSGCTTQGTIFVDISSDEIDAEFAVSSQVFIGETVVAVDISFPLPDGIEWILPIGAEISTQDKDAVEFSFAEAGEYDITIITTRGECIAQKTKKILVVAKDGLIQEEDDKSGQKLVEEFIVYPNPTSGKFTADINLTERGDVSVKVFSFSNNSLVASQKERGETTYSIPFDISGMPSGVYAVLLETPYGTSLRKIVVR